MLSSVRNGRNSNDLWFHLRADIINGACQSDSQFLESSVKREFTVIIEHDREGYYVAVVPDLPGCHTQAKSLDRLQERIREAIEVRLDLAHGALTDSEVRWACRISIKG